MSPRLSAGWTPASELAITSDSLLGTLNTARIRARPEAVLQAAAEALEWPRLLPHYRGVALVKEEKDRKVFIMKAHRDGLPVRWTAEQRVDRKGLAVHWKHVAGWTRGMDVVWQLSRKDGGCAVALSHDLAVEGAFSRWFYRRVVLDFFVHDIAQKTLEGLQRHLEA